MSDFYLPVCVDGQGNEGIQESCHPISKDIDSSTRIVHIGEDVAWLAVAAIRESFSTPSSSATRLAPKFA
jgi:hypothetical protein